MITFAAQFAVVCCASFYVEIRKARLEQKKERESTRAFLLTKSFSQQCTVDDFLRVNSYTVKYYNPFLLLEFITLYEDTMNKKVDIHALNSFLDNPQKMYDQLTVMIPVQNKQEIQVFDI